jgi:hypothetical protein
VTDATAAVKLALVAFDATVTEVGSVTAELLLESVTDWPPLPARDPSVTVHASDPAPVMFALAQVKELIPGATPMPVRAITAELFVEELLVSSSLPLDAPACNG